MRRATVWIPLDDGSLFISIHALLAESDKGLTARANVQHHFYPRSPCGERRYLCMYVHNLAHISIHALLAESDAEKMKVGGIDVSFLSTLSLRRATTYGALKHVHQTISIHALLAESDLLLLSIV